MLAPRLKHELREHEHEEVEVGAEALREHLLHVRRDENEVRQQHATLLQHEAHAHEVHAALPERLLRERAVAAAALDAPALEQPRRGEREHRV